MWIAVSWRSLVGYWGWQSAPTYYYDYGNTVVYEGDTVYYDSKPAATAEEYYEQASAISKRGEAKADEDEDWKSLGVWAMVQDGQTESNKILQLAVNKEGIIRGSHYDALTEATMLIQGAVDQKTQRAAWTIGDNGSIVYETGIFNLTQTETEMLIHFGKDSTQQWSLVRLEAPDQDDSSE